MPLPAPDSVSDNSGVVTVTIDVDRTVYNVSDNVQLDLATSPHLLQYRATDNSMNTAVCDVYITVVGKSHFGNRESFKTLFTPSTVLLSTYSCL